MKITNLYKGAHEVFPQANDIYKIYELGKAYYQGIYNVDKLKAKADIKNDRQFQYYHTAGSFLYIFEKTKSLTKLGNTIFSQDDTMILKLIVFQILSIEVFNDYFVNQDKQKTIDTLKSKYGLSDVTAERRYQTLSKWCDWCQIVIDDYEMNLEIVR